MANVLGLGLQKAGDDTPCSCVQSGIVFFAFDRNEQKLTVILLGKAWVGRDDTHDE